MALRPAVGVLVVDDHEPFRRFVCSILSKTAGWQVVGEVSDGLEAVQRAEELQPDLILLDIGLSKSQWSGSRRSYTTSRPELKNPLRNSETLFGNDMSGFA